MKEEQKNNTSKLLSLVLRHKPETIGLTLDAAGWVDVRELLDALGTNKTPLSKAELEELVLTNSKQRFAFNDDHTKIRASQ